MLYSGKLIGNIRNLEKIKLATLAHGLCSTAQLARIESGVRSAEKFLFDSLYERLGKYSGRFTVLLDCKEYQQLQARIRIYDYIDMERYAEALNEIKLYKGTTKNNIHKQFLCLAECEIMHRTNIDIFKRMEKLMEGIEYTYPGFNIENIGMYYLSRMEMLMAQQYVRYMELLGNNDKAVRLYHDILMCLENERYDRSEREIRYRHVGFWLMQHYIEKGQYYKAIEIGEKSYEHTVSGQKLMFLAELKDGIIKCKEALGEDMSDERKKLLVLYRMNNKYGVRCAEDFFPRYNESHAVNVNEVIRQRRVMYGITQEKLSEGICDVTTISRLENNKHKINDILGVQLLQRLHLSGDKYISCVDTYDYTVFEMVNRINDANIGGKYLVVKELLNQIQYEYNLSTVNSKQYIVRFTEMQADNIDSDKEIINALKLTLSIDKCSKNVILFENEWGLIGDLVFCYEKKKQYDKALMYATMLKPSKEEAMTNDFGFREIIAGVQKGDILGELGEVEAAKIELHNAINWSVKIDTNARIPSLMYIYAWNILEKKTNITDVEMKDCAEMLEYSYVLSLIYNNERRIKIIKKIWNKITLIDGTYFNDELKLSSSLSN